MTHIDVIRDESWKRGRSANARSTEFAMTATISVHRVSYENGLSG